MKRLPSIPIEVITMKNKKIFIINEKVTVWKRLVIAMDDTSDADEKLIKKIEFDGGYFSDGDSNKISLISKNYLFHSEEPTFPEDNNGYPTLKIYNNYPCVESNRIYINTSYTKENKK